MNERDRSVLINIGEECAVIAELITGFALESFLRDERTKRAVAMSLINVGELTKLLSFETRSKHNHIPWKDIAGLRDVTAHGYKTLRMDDIWDTAKNEMPYRQLAHPYLLFLARPIYFTQSNLRVGLQSAA
ncbi:MAG: DUF86 domain-containing protein [Peptococcaceae bacterium]|jgi:uncharacterized protein with HEPN domain|nr:DUF86 domain-containing protein [Peptococcaceae bacterium]